MFSFPACRPQRRWLPCFEKSMIDLVKTVFNRPVRLFDPISGFPVVCLPPGPFAIPPIVQLQVAWQPARNLPRILLATDDLGLAEMGKVSDI